MKTFTPSAPIAAFFEALIAQANQAPYQAANAGGVALLELNIVLPPIPAAPSDPVELAFFTDICMNLYNQLQAAAAAQAADLAQYPGVTAPSASAPQYPGAAPVVASQYDLSAQANVSAP
jgi:hypothetical protein